MIRSFLLLLLLPLLTLAQGPRKSNLILITSDEPTASMAFKKAVAILLANGYVIGKSDASHQTLETCAKVISNDVTININLNITNGDEIHLTGNTFIPNVGMARIANLGMSGSPANVSWKELVRLAGILGTIKNYRIVEDVSN